METIIEHINVMGSFVFAISGALIAMRKKLDPFGVLIVAFVTAVGGGTVRDMLLSKRDVFWLFDTTIIYVILTGCLQTHCLVSLAEAKQKCSIFIFNCLHFGILLVKWNFTILLLQEVNAFMCFPMLSDNSLLGSYASRKLNQYRLVK